MFKNGRLIAIYKVDRPASLSSDNGLNCRIGVFLDRPVLRRRGSLSAKVQRSALPRDMILQIDKFFEA